MAKAKITPSQLQSALSLAKHSAAAREGRRKPLLLNRAELAGDPQLRKNRRALETLLASYAVKSGLDLDRFEQLNATNQGDLRRAVDARKAAAVKQSTATMQALHQQVDGRRRALEHLANKAAPTGPNARRAGLADPDLADRRPLVDSSSIEPWNSTAKFRVQSSNSNASPAFSFWYIWVNRDEKFALIDVAGMLVVNGFCEVGSDGGLLPGFRVSAVDIDASLALLDGSSNVPQTSPIQNVVFLSTNTGGLFASSAIDWQTVFDGYILQFSELIVPPGELVLIEVVLTVNYASADGNVDVDFSSGEFNVMSPFAAVTVLS